MSSEGPVGNERAAPRQGAAQEEAMILMGLTLAALTVTWGLRLWADHVGERYHWGLTERLNTLSYAAFFVAYIACVLAVLGLLFGESSR